MSPGLEPRLASLLVYAVALLGAHTVLRRRRTPEKRRREGDQWARRHLAYVETRWTPNVDRCPDRNRRVHLWVRRSWARSLERAPFPGPASSRAWPSYRRWWRSLGYTATRPDYLPPARALALGNGLPVTLDYPTGTVGGTPPGLAVLGWLQLVVVLGVLGALGWVVARSLRDPQAKPSGAHRRAAASVPGDGRTTPAAWTSTPAAPRDVPAATRPAVPPAGRPGERRTRSRAEWAAAAPPVGAPGDEGRRAEWAASTAPAAVPLAEAGLPAPPPDISPGLLAVLHSGGKGTDAVTATLLDLAVRGYLRVEEQAGRWRPRGWTLVATAPTTPDRLAPHEEALLHNAFGGTPTTTVSEVCHRRTRALEAAHKALVAEAVERGWVAKNVLAACGKAVGLSIFFIGFVAAIVNFDGFPRSFPFPFPFFFLAIGTGIVGVFTSALLSLVKPVRRTAAGNAVLAELATYRAELAGLGLERIPSDRAAEVFSRSLPHAAALGLPASGRGASPSSSLLRRLPRGQVPPGRAGGDGARP